MRYPIWLVLGLIAFIAVGCRASLPVQSDASSVVPKELQAMPPFDFKDLEGKSWNTSHFKGQTVLIEFWATWCGPCRELAPDIHDLYKRNRSRVQLLSVSLDEDESTVRSFVKDRPFPNPVIHAGPALAKSWNLDQIPLLALVRDGRIVLTWQGRDAIRHALTTIEKEVL